MERVEFRSPREGTEDITLVGDYLPADSDAVIVMSHGFTGDRTEWGYFDEIANSLNDAGYSVLKYDFSGSGESDDEPLRIENQVKDLKAALDYVRSRGAEKIGLYGHSQGGLVSLRCCGTDIDAMVLTSPVTSSMDNYREERLSPEELQELEENGYWVKNRDRGPRDEILIDEKIIEEKENVDQDELLEGVRSPTLIIHGDEDPVVPLEDSRRAVDKLPDARLEVIKGLDHDYDTHLDRIEETAEKWFREKMAP